MIESNLHIEAVPSGADLDHISGCFSLVEHPDFFFFSKTPVLFSSLWTQYYHCEDDHWMSIPSLERCRDGTAAEASSPGAGPTRRAMTTMAKLTQGASH